MNAADPGDVATGLTGHQGFNSIADGYAPSVRRAILPEDGPTAGLHNMGGQTSW